ncbi:hypothetical protein BJ944DRAFT_198233 [Cunninghamella echinulata]|nr:hypothetical protein BJ944DRAFT_198233 [Cunninghamella echinulata]
MYYQKKLLSLLFLLCTVKAQQPENQSNTTAATTDNTTTSTSSIPEIMIQNESNFCLFLPPKPGQLIAPNEDNSIAFCLKANSAPGAKLFPKNFITTAHYYKTDAYEQVTGFFNRDAYQLDPNDGGGQYDAHAKHKPIDAICKGYPHFVSLIEPSNNRFCLRCCKNNEDCPTGRSEYGCLRVVIPGNYEDTNTFDHVPPQTSASNVTKNEPSTKNQQKVNQQNVSPSTATGNDGTPSPQTSPAPITTTTNDTSTAATNTKPDPISSNDNTNTDSNGNNTENKDQQPIKENITPPPATQPNTPTENDNTDSTTMPKEPIVNENQPPQPQLQPLPAKFLTKVIAKRSIKNQVDHLKQQLNQHDVDLNQIKSQFSTITKRYASMNPKLKRSLEKLNNHASSFTTIEQWKDFVKS